MDRTDDKRIAEALELLNAVARDKKSELEAALQNKYDDLTTLVGELGGRMKSRAAEKYEAGKQKAVDTAKDIDTRVHRNPWAYVAGAALAGLLLGVILSKSRRD
jgi:ElaB/YqjD/DUF883 family membrane-anchored ribosome-binding protein